MFADTTVLLGVLNIILAMSAASATESVVNKISKREKDRSKTTLSLMNAMLTAAVAVKSGCEIIPTWSAVVAGLGSAPLYYASTLQFKKYDFIFHCITAIQRLQALKKNLVRILPISGLQKKVSE